MWDGDLCNLIDNEIMMKGVDRNCSIVMDVEDKITTIDEPYTKEYLYKLVLRTMNSLIGETSNCATTYHNKIAKTDEHKKKYEQYIDLLSVINGKAIDFAKTGVIFNIPPYIAKGGKPLPYFMRYRSEYYNKQSNLSRTWSNMNRLAYDIEKWERKSVKFKNTYKDFDYSIMINPNIKFDEDRFNQIERVFLEFCKEIDELSKENRMLREPEKYKNYFHEMYPDQTLEDLRYFTINWNYYYNKYKNECKKICANKQELANIAVTLCYEKYPSRNKKFMWKVASDGILLNLKQKSIFLPKKDQNGEFEYLGKKYSLMEVLEID